MNKCYYCGEEIEEEVCRVDDNGNLVCDECYMKVMGQEPAEED